MLFYQNKYNDYITSKILRSTMKQVIGWYIEYFRTEDMELTEFGRQNQRTLPTQNTINVGFYSVCIDQREHFNAWYLNLEHVVFSDTAYRAIMVYNINVCYYRKYDLFFTHC